MNPNNPPHDNVDNDSDDGSVSDVESIQSIDAEEQRQLDIDALFDRVMQDDKTRHFESISDASAMHMSPDGIILTIEPDGSKTVKFSNLDHDAMPQWYRDEHNETVLKRIASLEASLATTKAKLETETQPDPVKEAKVLKSIARLENKLNRPNLSEAKRTRYQQLIDSLTNGALESARGNNEALKEKYNARIASLEAQLETTRASLR